MEIRTQFTVADVRVHLTDALNTAAYGKERVMIMRRNKPLAYIVPMEDIELLEQIEDRYDAIAAKKALDEASSEGFIDWEELKKELD
ncbi:MAG: type II toxin-antitoxin system prevent-host-death family antitoxin [Pseudomonadota bacterium]